MITHTKESFAAMLHGREYGSEITHMEESVAKAMGFVVIFGYSDDCIEIRGAFRDELGSRNNKGFRIGSFGVLKSWDDLDRDNEAECEKYFHVKARANHEIRAVWSGPTGFDWTYETAIPHACFDIMEDGEKYCRGIVFNVSDLGIA